MTVKLYLTKQSNGNFWNYITDPEHPTKVQPMGLVSIGNRREIMVDKFGAYVERVFI